MESSSTSGILFVGKKPELLPIQLPSISNIRLYKTNTLTKALHILKKRKIKILLSDEIICFEKVMKKYPEPLRLLFVDQLDLDTTKAAINRCEVFRCLPKNAPPSEFFQIIGQAIEQYDVSEYNRKLLYDLKNQNKKLEKIIYHLEKEVSHKTKILRNVEYDLQQSSRYLEQLNTIIAWINASVSLPDLETRIEMALKGVLPAEKIILSQHTDKRFVEGIKKLGKPVAVIPLVYDKKRLGHLYLICQNEEDIQLMTEKLNLLKQVSDTVALTLEKIKIFEVAARRKEEWEKTFDAIKDPVSLVNHEYRIVRSNLRYSEISGVRIQDLSGKKCYEVFQKRTSPCDGCLLKEAILKQVPKNFELLSKAQDTSYSTSSFPLSSSSDSLAVMYYKNQGEERKLRDQLIQSEKMAELGILAGSIAHEINNPMGGILAFTQILLSDVNKGTQLYEDLKEIEKAATRSKTIVENLLYFSKTSHAHEKVRMNFSEVLEKALSLIELKIHHRNIKIHQSLEPVPPIYGDFNALVHVFFNLFQNAAEALKREGNIWISTHFYADTRKIEIKIKDNGKGMDPEELSKIFNPFYTTKNKIEHVGLGLSLSYRIIKEHKADIIVASEPNQGTTFTLLFPETSKN